MTHTETHADARATAGDAGSHYVRAGRAAALFNRFVGFLARRGVSVAGSAELTVLGRVSGNPQRIPVNPLEIDGRRYLVSARGHSQWVRNMRAAGGGELRIGRRVRPFTATEITDPAERVEVLRAYLRKWGWEVNTFFEGVTADSEDSVILARAPKHPIFRITEGAAGRRRAR
ncbi:nitroreductase family deazaflavin-dependent oxidoreductase (plasmid) [Streptomyces sp. BI20]|uniref:nitroreductase family deazaflavin-dependent oxidoreductase n=1 Tax=Streptomyces sp. BI20 TaxID=3403460 RepID=UPI003C77110D